MRADLHTLLSPAEASASAARDGQARAIESVDFPFERLSEIAEAESWRKEIHRPPYHIHKWWAQRLGSVFRAIVLGTFAAPDRDLLDLFYSPVRLPRPVVLDPFMGSGTTVGEALKLGARVVGFDINPVSHFLVRNALGMPSRREVLDTYQAIERDVAGEIRRLYRARLPDGAPAETLYYFWVKQVPCPACAKSVDLFSSYIFARHAYPGRHPEATALCPHCGGLNKVVTSDPKKVRCATCRHAYDPDDGPARGVNATCPGCRTTFPIAKTVRQLGTPPSHRLYAKLVLDPQGEKHYLPADSFDHELYAAAERLLEKRRHAYPIVKIAPGHNTNQVLNYCYTHWHQMFSARQLLALSVLAERIQGIPAERLRGLFACLFSGVLEFNNMFTSFKGEGTGAVRHMFYHHILKPERDPLEANVWGTPKSSGAFSTLFRSRLLRALDYCEDPSELQLVREKGRIVSAKVHGLSEPLAHEACDSAREFAGGHRLYLACRDSAHSDLPDRSVDAVITDPPFFDNVHYSELADFFYVWQRHILGTEETLLPETTRSEAEVQQKDPEEFTRRLAGVWRECHRVLKDDGLLVFTYHHSRAEGWKAVLASLVESGFVVVRTHPIKSEMSVATPKHQANEPIDLDVIVVCRPRATRGDTLVPPSTDHVLRDAREEAQSQLRRLRRAGRTVSRNDVRVILSGQILTRLSRSAKTVDAVSTFEKIESLVDDVIEELASSIKA